MSENNLAGSMANGMMGRARRRHARSAMKDIPKTQGPLTDETLASIQEGFSRIALPEEAWEWVAKHGQTIISELKELSCHKEAVEVYQMWLLDIKKGRIGEPPNSFAMDTREMRTFAEEALKKGEAILSDTRDTVEHGSNKDGKG